MNLDSGDADIVDLPRMKRMSFTARRRKRPGDSDGSDPGSLSPLQ